MHTGRSYRTSELLAWTRRSTGFLVLWGVVAVALYEVAGLQWLSVPWAVVALLGTATAFIVGFQNIQAYNRAWEARQIRGEIAGSSRAWGVMSRDFLDDMGESRQLVYRHFAWLTSMRYQMRDPRPWESLSTAYNAEYRRAYSIPERETPLDTELAKYLPAEEVEGIRTASNKSSRILALQGSAVRELFAKQELVVLQFVDMQRAIREFCVQQARSERIKDFPYPRQFATVSALFVKLFCLMLPFGLLREFDKLGDGVDALLKGSTIWLVVPFSALISWMYASLEQVGEITESPFEGGANDVPISHICRSIEIELREMLGETELPPSHRPKNGIVL